MESLTRNIYLKYILFSLLAIIYFNSPAYANTDCLKKALIMMAGKYEASGKKIGKSGDLEDFRENFESKLDSYNSITFYSSNKKYGSWVIIGNQYKLIMYDSDGKQKEDPIEISYSCVEDIIKKTIELTERWIALPDQSGQVWVINQTRKINGDSVNVTTTIGEQGSSLPFIVISTYIAKRIVEGGDEISEPELPPKGVGNADEISMSVIGERMRQSTSIFN